MSADNLCADGLWDFKGSIGRHFDFARPTIKESHVAGREGRDAWSRVELDRYMIAAKWAISTQGAFMNVIEELKKDYGEAQKLWETYDSKLTQFRSQVKNDVSSLEAGARKTTEAVTRMNKAYADVFAQLNGPEMASAIANAERLATAMQSLATLQSHKLTFAVIDAAPKP